MNGEEGDELDMRPFDKFFTKERILSSWVKVGFVPFTRKCLENKKVRHERGQEGGDGAVKKVETMRSRRWGRCV